MSAEIREVAAQFMKNPKARLAPSRFEYKEMADIPGVPIARAIHIEVMIPLRPVTIWETSGPMDKDAMVLIGVRAPRR
jgi:hypothetical protein